MLTDEDAREIDIRFSYHGPKGDQKERYELLRHEGKALATEIGRLCPNSVERAIAWTYLEQAIMYANAAIARRE